MVIEIESYTYVWSNGATTATAHNLSAGTHTVTVSNYANTPIIHTFNIGGSYQGTYSFF